MKKIKLSETSKNNFIQFSKDRKSEWTRTFDYLLEDILSNVYDWFSEHNLTVEENARAYYTQNGKKEILCYGYSGYSSDVRDDKDGIIYNLFHETWCQAEWLARSQRGDSDWYIEAVESTFGRDYKKLLESA